MQSILSEILLRIIAKISGGIIVELRQINIPSAEQDIFQSLLATSQRLFPPFLKRAFHEPIRDVWKAGRTTGVTRRVRSSQWPCGLTTIGILPRPLRCSVRPRLYGDK